MGGGNKGGYNVPEIGDFRFRASERLGCLLQVCFVCVYNAIYIKIYILLYGNDHE